MCYITLEIVVKLTGGLTPSAGLKFADIPNRLAAISEVPAGGWGQILAYGGFYELSLDQSAVGPGRGNEFVSRAGERKIGHHGIHRHGPPGWPHWLCLWHTGLVHSISAARVR